MDESEHLLSWIENPRVTGSIPVPATIKSSSDIFWAFFTSVGYADLCRISCIGTLKCAGKILKTLENLIYFSTKFDLTQNAEILIAANLTFYAATLIFTLPH